MPRNIRSEAVNRLAERVAACRGVNKTAAVRLALADVLEQASAPVTSPIAIFEAALGLCRKRQARVAEAEADVRAFLEMARIRVVAVTDAECASALDAFSRYGKGRGHPAQLNLGDCFAYAVAMNHRTTLLFNGDDFNRTDIRFALLRPGR